MPIAFAANDLPARETGLSVFHLMLNASGGVKFVLLVLIAFSIVTWAVILFKYGIIRRSFVNSENFLDVFWSGKSMDHIYAEAKKQTTAPVAKIFQSGYVELQRLLERQRQKSGDPQDPAKLVPPDSALSNLERSLARANRSETMRLERSLTFLATAGSTAPFIGLFGTVWGIMNAFWDIGAKGGASLAVVAPGIAEALIATAVGLACAIPAVMGYNYYTHKVRAIRILMDNFASDFLNIIKRNFMVS